MKYGVPVNEKSEKASISDVFGRSAFVAIVDEGGSVEYHDNPGKAQARGSGMATAQFLADQNVTNVVAANIGPNAQNALDSQGISVETKTGTLEDILKGLK